MDQEAIARAAALLREARRAVALTGAGLSTESGIPDFRSPGGLWSRFDPEDFAFARFVSLPEARRRYWKWSLELYPALRDAQPNAGHVALAALERAGRLRCVVTQNIDGLHRRAGSVDVIEIHGTAARVVCLACGEEWPREAVQARLARGEEDPACTACGGVLKPRVVLFGEPMPEERTRRAFEEADSADLLLAAGSSLVVHPAAGLVPTAKSAGARIVIVNLEPTGYDDLADVVVRGRAGEALAAIARAVLEPP